MKHIIAAFVLSFLAPLLFLLGLCCILTAFTSVSEPHTFFWMLVAGTILIGLAHLLK